MDESKKNNIRSPLADVNMYIIFFVTLIAVMGIASTSPAFPEMAEYFETSPQKIGYILTAFTLPGVFLSPIFGVLADRYGRRRVLLPALFVFGFAGGSCAFVDDFNLLLLLVFIQGVGVTPLGSLNVTMIGDLYEGQQRTKAMGYNSSVLSIGTGSYPLIGGILADFGWRYPFLLPFIAIFVGIFAWKWLKLPLHKGKLTLKDYLNTTIDSIKDIRISGLFFITVVSFILLFGVFLTYFPFLLNNHLGAEPYQIGILMALTSFTTAVTSFFLHKLREIFSGRAMLSMAFAMYAIAIFLMYQIDNIYLMALPMFIYGAAQGLNLPNIHNMLANLADKRNIATLLSIYRTFALLGQSVGPLIMGFIFGFGQIHMVFYAGAVIAIITGIFVLLGLKKLD